MTVTFVKIKYMVNVQEANQCDSQLSVMTTTQAAIRLGLAIYLAQMTAANAAEIKLLTTRSIAIVLDEIGPVFERTTGHRLVTIVELAPVLKRRIDAGEEFDMAAFAASFIDQLIDEGKLVASTRTNLVRAGIGIAVRAGAPRPDIESVESFKQALLRAKSIAYLKEGASGVYLAGMVERLGIAERLKSKTTLPTTDTVSELVAKGEVEIGMVVIPNILAMPGAELVGPLPRELQVYFDFPAAIGVRAKQAQAAKELIEFLRGPLAVKVIRSKGMEPR
ncbi:MAG TPA: substrate-binding domain-containing protein [Bryobacteraceae bacterium]|jgi:molybdate transport system substrate-binding protein|nr:substrate-binding domain-containing protein [Bryobacteraceae bacterium]